MKLSAITAAKLKQLTRLIQAKELLTAKLAALDAQFERLTTEHTSPRKGPPGSRRKRRRLREEILPVLKTAGKDGITVAELARVLKMKPANIHSWFASTGKRIEGVTQPGRGRYACA